MTASVINKIDAFAATAPPRGWTNLFDFAPKGSRYLMAVSAFFDESGTHGAASGYTVMGGLMGDEDQWKAFDIAWCRVLNSFGLSDFHAKEYFGPRAVKQTITDPRGLPQQLLRVISDVDLHPTLHTLDNAEHKAKKLAGKTSYSYYGQCFSACLGECLKAMARYYPDKKLRVIVEHGHLNQGAANEIFKHMRSTLSGRLLDYCIAARKKDYIALQAADLYAYLTYTARRDHLRRT